MKSSGGFRLGVRVRVEKGEEEEVVEGGGTLD